MHIALFLPKTGRAKALEGPAVARTARNQPRGAAIALGAGAVFPYDGCNATRGIRGTMANRMGTDPMGRLLVRFALPVVAGLLISRFYILVDGMFVGQALGPAGVAATTIAMPFVTLLNALIMLIGDGGTAVLALRLGAGRRGDAAQVLGNALFMLLGASVLLGGTVMLWADPLLALAGASGPVLEQAKTYLVITVFGTFALGFSLGIDTFLRAAGFPNRTLFVQVLGAVANIGLDYAFVMVFGWGIVGAAVATVLGQVVAMAVTMALLFRRDMPFRLRGRDLRPAGPLIGRMALLGMPSFIVRGSDAALNIVLNALVVGYGASTALGGDDALAVSGAISRVTQFALVPAIGIAIGMRPLVGFNFGAGDGVRVRGLVVRAAVAGSACLAVLWAAIEIEPGLLMSLFGFEGDTAVFACWALRVSLLAMPILMIRITGTNYFQGIGRAKKAIVLTFCQQVVFLLPLLVLAPLVLPLVTDATPLESVFWGMFAADVASTALVAWFLACDPGLRVRA